MQLITVLTSDDENQEQGTKKWAFKTSGDGFLPSDRKRWNLRRVRRR